MELPTLTCKKSVFIATSVDGFIARRDGGLDWLEAANSLVPPGEDCGYGAFITSVDTVVMGRHTFEKVLSFPDWPYQHRPVVVLSSKPITLAPQLPRTVTSSNESPSDLCRRLAATGAKHLYIDGGVTIQRFLAEGLIDEITVTIIPVLLGAGRPLFGSLPHQSNLKHVATKSFPFGFVQSTYRLTP